MSSSLPPPSTLSTLPTTSSYTTDPNRLCDWTRTAQGCKDADFIKAMLWASTGLHLFVGCLGLWLLVYRNKGFNRKIVTDLFMTVGTGIRPKPMDCIIFFTSVSCVVKIIGNLPLIFEALDGLWWLRITIEQIYWILVAFAFCSYGVGLLYAMPVTTREGIFAIYQPETPFGARPLSPIHVLTPTTVQKNIVLAIGLVAPTFFGAAFGVASGVMRDQGRLDLERILMIVQYSNWVVILWSMAVMFFYYGLKYTFILRANIIIAEAALKAPRAAFGIGNLKSRSPARFLFIQLQITGFGGCAVTLLAGSLCLLWVIFKEKILVMSDDRLAHTLAFFWTCAIAVAFFVVMSLIAAQSVRSRKRSANDPSSGGGTTGDSTGGSFVPSGGGHGGSGRQGSVNHHGSVVGMKSALSHPGFKSSKLSHQHHHHSQGGRKDSLQMQAHILSRGGDDLEASALTFGGSSGGDASTFQSSEKHSMERGRDGYDDFSMVPTSNIDGHPLSTGTTLVSTDNGTSPPVAHHHPHHRDHFLEDLPPSLTPPPRPAMTFQQSGIGNGQTNVHSHIRESVFGGRTLPREDSSNRVSSPPPSSPTGANSGSSGVFNLPSFPSSAKRVAAAAAAAAAAASSRNSVVTSRPSTSSASYHTTSINSFSGGQSIVSNNGSCSSSNNNNSNNNNNSSRASRGSTSSKPIQISQPLSYMSAQSYSSPPTSPTNPTSSSSSHSQHQHQQQYSQRRIPNDLGTIDSVPSTPTATHHSMMTTTGHHHSSPPVSASIAIPLPAASRGGGGGYNQNNAVRSQGIELDMIQQQLLQQQQYQQQQQQRNISQQIQQQQLPPPPRPLPRKQSLEGAADRARGVDKSQGQGQDRSSTLSEDWPLPPSYQ